jgi:hypothetical protein
LRFAGAGWLAKSFRAPELMAWQSDETLPTLYLNNPALHNEAVGDALNQGWRRSELVPLQL